jgi:hypothetical protein
LDEASSGAEEEEAKPIAAATHQAKPDDILGTSDEQVWSVEVPKPPAPPKPPPPDDKDGKTNPERKWTHDIGMTLTTALGVVAVVAYTIVAGCQAHLQYQTLQEMQVEQRPWIAVNLVPSESVTDPKELGKVGSIVDLFDLKRRDDGGRVNFRVSLTNVGHSPAFHVTLWIEGFLFGLSDKPDPEAAQHVHCDPLTNLALDPGNKGTTIFPGQTLDWKLEGVDPYAGWSRSASQKAGFNLNGHHRIMLFVYGCADYVFGAPFQNHQTGFLYMIDSAKFASGEQTNSIPDDVALSGDDIRIYPWGTAKMRTD